MGSDGDERLANRLTPTERGLLSEIVAHPDDDEPRLVYADWLEENGFGPRAQLLRDSIRRPRPPYIGELETLRAQELERAGLGLCRLDRGLAIDAWARPDRLVTQAEVLWPLVATEPLLQIYVTVQAGDLANYGIALEMLQQDGWPIRVFFRAAAVSARDIHPARGLRCITDLVTTQSLVEICRSPHLMNVRRLTINRLDEQEAIALSSHDCPFNLRVLECSNRGHIVESSIWPMLFRSARWESLAELGLGMNALSDDGARALAGCRHLTGLEELRLTFCPLTNSGALALAQSAYLPRGMRLQWRLVTSLLTSETVAELRQRFRLRE